MHNDHNPNQFPICDIEPTSGIGRIGHRQFEITPTRYFKTQDL